MATGSTGQINVMVVDDSTVLRGLLSRMIEKDPALKVVATASNGSHAISTLQGRGDIDVILLDIEMPVMDGMEALPELRKASPNTAIIMISALTLKGAEITMRALSMGAADFIPKPSSGRAASRVENMASELIMKIKTHSNKQVPAPSANIAKVVTTDTASVKAAAPKPKAISTASPSMERGLNTPRIIAIGSSTGGPNALEEVFRTLNPAIRLPIVITQHMPPMFTTILAQRLDGLGSRRCIEASDGLPLEDNTVYIAPGDYHMEINRIGSGHVIALNQNPAEHFCRPAVDVMFRSLAKSFGRSTLAIVLTGMGEDGKMGAEELYKLGSSILVQDQESSVVWGMPGAIANAGLATEILPLETVSTNIEKYLRMRVRS